MDKVLTEMMYRYDCQTHEDYQNALKEIIQDIALLGLWRAKFFENAAFYGGTALRILYGLDRFSEDLDFILLKRDPEFGLKTYENALENELKAFGMTVEVSEKRKTKESAIRSAFLKANTKEHVLKVGAPKGVLAAFQLEQVIKIKLEVDTDPSGGFVTETHDLIYPVPFWIRTLAQGSLFAGKLHAVLCRGWGARVKGRDWYDMVWFVKRKIPAQLTFLEKKMRQTGHYSNEEPLTEAHVRQMLHQRIDELDIDRAKEDVSRFIHSPASLDGWSSSIFHTVVDRMNFE